MNTYDDIIDTREIIARFEELESQREELREEFDNEPANNGVDFDHWVCNSTGSAWGREEQTELDALTAILEELKGNGGDEQWRGDWYPVTLIRDSYFEQYMDDLICDIGDIPRDLPAYLRIEIDYTMLQQDYSSIEIDGVDYWYR